MATSAIRDATNREELLTQAYKRGGLQLEVLSPEEEARYGYLAVVNSTSIGDGVALDLGGGSLQLVPGGRAPGARHALVAARRGAHDRALPARRRRPSRKQLKALRTHVREELGSAGWLEGAAERDGTLAGIGGTLRNLATAAQMAADLPSYGVQGFAARAATRWTSSWSGSPPCRASERGEVPGHQARARRPDPGRRGRDRGR